MSLPALSLPEGGLVPPGAADLPGSRSAPGSRRHAAAWSLLAVLLLALVVRVVGVWADLPYVYNADEPTNLGVVDAMVTNGDGNPRFFNYPSLSIYLQAAVHLDGPLLSWLPGDREQPLTSLVMGSAMSATPEAVLVHRGLTVLLGTFVVVFTWLATRALTGGHLAATAAAGLVALSPTLIEQSRLVTPDMLAATLVAATCWLSVRLLHRGTWPAYALAGLSVGLAASAKYNAVLVASAVVAASLLCRHPGALRRAVGLPLAAVAAVVGFCLTTPYAVLDRVAFVAALGFEREHYSTGHAGMEGGTPAFYASYLLRHEPVLVLVGVAGAAMVLYARREDVRWRGALVLAAFPLVYGGAISTLAVRNDQTVMLVLPPLAMLAGLAVDQVLRRTAPGTLRRGAPVLVAALLLVVYGGWTAFPPRGPSTYQAAQDWLTERSPSGARVLVESYTPFLDPGRYALVARTRLIDAPLPGSDEVDFVIASEAMYGRFVQDAERYPVQAEAYRRVFASLTPVATFTGDGPTLGVFRVRDPP
ncbi:MAG: ArnT family glycosyltransferase [Mycobacteriales bacterium]